MIEFQKIRYKNFLSVGDQPVEISFNDYQTLLIQGVNGSGKCVRGCTEVDVYSPDKKMDEEFRKFLKENQKRNCTVQDVYNFYKEFPERRGSLQARTSKGWHDIQVAEITAKNSRVMRLNLSGGAFLECSPDHRVWTYNDWIHVKNLDPGDSVQTIWGWRQVSSVEVLEFREDLFDFQIADVQEYYTNGIRSHNSTILEALVFALYNKSFRKTNKPQIVNSINGRNTLVELWFRANGNQYYIKRGIKPNVFEIYENKKLVQQEAKNTDYQRMLENNILKINFLTFCQCVVLSTSNFRPFMELTSAQRREVIEDLLDIKIFTLMNKVLKDRIRETTDRLKDVRHEVELKQLRADSVQEQISLIERQSQDTLESIQSKAKEKKQSFREVKQQIKDAKERLEKERAIHQEIADQLGKKNLAETMEQKIKDKRKKYLKELDFFQTNDRCPTCYQEIQADFVPKLIEKRNSQIEEIDLSLEQLQEKLDSFKKIEKSLQAKSKEISEIEQEIQNLQTRQSLIKDELNKLHEEYQQHQQQQQQNASEERDTLHQLQKEIHDLTQEQKNLETEQEYQTVSQRLLKDDGIKATIIRKYLPLINQKILEYLDKFDFHTAFRLDEEFNEEILARYCDQFSYENFSAGERQRIDLALLFAWRDVARKKNSVATNLLFLDEILDSSCDQRALECLMGILLEKAQNGTHMVVISHRNSDMFYDRFEAQITMEKDARGFSRISNMETG